MKATKDLVTFLEEDNAVLLVFQPYYVLRIYQSNSGLPPPLIKS